MRPVGWTHLQRSSETAVVGHRTCGNQWHSGVEAAGTGESDARERGRECCARDGTVGVAQYVMPTLQGTEGRVNARETGAGCNDWISWSNNYSVWPVIGRGKHTLGEELGSPFVPCCDFPARLLQVIIHTRRGFMPGG